VGGPVTGIVRRAPRPPPHKPPPKEGGAEAGGQPTQGSRGSFGPGAPCWQTCGGKMLPKPRVAGATQRHFGGDPLGVRWFVRKKKPGV